MKNFTLLILLCISFNGFAQLPVFTGLDLNSGADSSNPLLFVKCNGKVLFTAKTAAEGYEL